MFKVLTNTVRLVIVVGLLPPSREAGLPEPLFAERRHFDETAGQALLEEVDVVGLQPGEFAAKADDDSGNDDNTMM